MSSFEYERQSAAKRAATYVRDSTVQFKILCYKNWKMSYRGWKMTCVELAAPVFFVLVLLVLQHVPQKHDDDQFNPDWTPVEPIPLCHGRTEKKKDCYPLFYAPNDDPRINKLMTIVADKNNLSISYDTDLSKTRAIIGWNSSNEFTKYVEKHQNTTYGGFGFHLDDVPQDLSLLNYTFFINASCPGALSGRKLCKNYRIVLLRALHEAYQCYLQDNNSTGFAVSTSYYPYAGPPSDAVTSFGALFFYIGGIFFFIILMYQVVWEKEHKLRMGMRMMGLKSLVYWLSWTLHSQIILILSSLLLITTGYACQFAFFLQTNFIVLFLIFYVFGLAMCQLAFLLAVIVPNTKTAIYTGMMIFILGLFITLIFASFGGLVYPKLYGNDTTGNVFQWLLTLLLPMYNFSKVVFDVSSRSFKQGRVKGDGYPLDQLFKEYKLKGGATLPPTYQSLLYLVAQAVVYTIIAWYLDNIMASAGGKPKPWYFLFTPSYWGFSRPKAYIPPASDGEGYDSDVIEERSKAADASKYPFRCTQLSKVFRRFPLGIPSSKDVVATSDFTVGVREGEILALLGHNGAGKTTTINMLTGIYAPTRGDAHIYGRSIISDMEGVQAITGVCPQHDILWNELTAAEHLYIFADLQGVPWSQRKQKVEEKLRAVHLYDVKDKPAGSYSGGMKRRLSVAISCIGDPKIIFMDEPTTGMDPMSKRQVWDLIQELKKDRVIVLTTHSMEEADVLGDRVAIMSHGEIRCIGTSLHLKNKFGDGYRINVVARPDGVEDCKMFMQEQMPGGFIIAETDEYLVYALPHEHLDVVVPFFEHVEDMMERDGEDSVIQDIGISHTTLEEVFLKITRQHNEEKGMWAVGG